MTIESRVASRFARALIADEMQREVRKALQPLTKVKPGLEIGILGTPITRGRNTVYKFQAYVHPGGSGGVLDIEVVIGDVLAEISVDASSWGDDGDGGFDYRKNLAKETARIYGDMKELMKLAEKVARQTKAVLED